jgi:hypothetical protein
VYFNEVRVIDQIHNARPDSEQQRFKICLSDVAQANPDDLGWRPLKHEAVKEISVTSKNRPVSLLGLIPKLEVGRSLAKVRGMGTIKREPSTKRSRKALVYEQVDHEASRTVERAELRLRAYSMQASTSALSRRGCASMTSSTASPAAK